MITWPKIELKKRPRRYVVTRNGAEVTIPYSVTQIVRGINPPDGLIQYNVNHTLSYLGENPGDLSGAKYYHKQVLNDLGRFGTVVHEMIEAYLRDEPCPHLVVGAEAKAAYEAWLCWWMIFTSSLGGVEIIAIERRVCGFQPHPFAGTFDLLIRCAAGHYYLLDWKTSKSLHPKYHFQLGGYAWALWHEHGLPIRAGYVVRMGRDGTMEVQEVRNLYYLGQCFATELSVFANYDRLKKDLSERKKLAKKQAKKQAKKEAK